jgi:3-polyprenyl-4-hydroxybenzoate decarboxylase
MQTATSTRCRTLRLTRTEAGSLALVITEQKGGRLQVDAYYLSPIEGGYRFSKHDCTVYTVTPSTCTCPGHVNHGRKGTVCKHRAALVALKERGKL